MILTNKIQQKWCYITYTSDSRSLNELQLSPGPLLGQSSLELSSHAIRKPKSHGRPGMGGSADDAKWRPNPQPDEQTDMWVTKSWDYSSPSHCLRDLKRSPNWCLETGEVTIIQDCLQDGHCKAVGTGNTGIARVWAQAIWLHSLHHSQAHYLGLW